MAMFNSYVSLPEGKKMNHDIFWNPISNRKAIIIVQILCNMWRYLIRFESGISETTYEHPLGFNQEPDMIVSSSTFMLVINPLPPI